MGPCPANNWTFWEGSEKVWVDVPWKLNSSSVSDIARKLFPRGDQSPTSANTKCLWNIQQMFCKPWMQLVATKGNAVAVTSTAVHMANRLYLNKMAMNIDVQKMLLYLPNLHWEKWLNSAITSFYISTPGRYYFGHFKTDRRQQFSSWEFNSSICGWLGLSQQDGQF